MYHIGAVLLYGGFLWAENRRGKAYVLPFRFLEGYLLAYLCFDFLLGVFQTEGFLCSGLFALAGIFVGAWGELRFLHTRLQWYLVATFLVIAIMDRLDMWTAVHAFTGGFGLYITSNGLMPENAEGRGIVCSAVGGSAGFVLGVILGMM